ncbi:MAG: cell envelope integrity protein CreD [Pseudomonadota bacterium]
MQPGSDETSNPPLPQNAMKALFKSRAWRFAVMIALTLVMCVPLMMVSFVISDRVSFKREAMQDVTRQWGGPIKLSGVVMVLPVVREVEKVVAGDLMGDRAETETKPAPPILLTPDTLSIKTDGTSEMRRRGIFEVPVYATDLTAQMDFQIARVASVLQEGETIRWKDARLAVIMPGSRSFSAEAVLQSGDKRFDLEPGTTLKNQSGIHASIGDPRGVNRFSLALQLNGAQTLSFAPAGRTTEVSMTSNWPDPSFIGKPLPQEREVTAEGFTARWEISHLARDLPQTWRGDWRGTTTFGVRLFNPVDIYQQVERAAKYGILFISLTFLTVFLIERFSSRPAHAAQLLLIGVAQCVFFLLLLSFAEQIGFARAYMIAAVATIGLISAYGRSALDLGRTVWALIGSLTALYGTLYLILRSADYALLAGSLLGFAAVALAMFLTRGDDWSRARGEQQPA